MFRFDRDTLKVEDSERGLVVRQVGGPGHGVFAAEMHGENWKFRFLVSTESDRSRFVDGKLITNPDYSVRLQINVYPVEGSYDRPETPFELAREAALTREIEFFKADPQRIFTNGPA